MLISCPASSSACSNERSRQMVADLSLDKHMLQEVIEKSLRRERKLPQEDGLVASCRVSIRTGMEHTAIEPVELL